MRLHLVSCLSAVALAQDTNPFGRRPDAVEAGRELFLGACSACHGANAEGGTGPNLITGRQVNRIPDRQLFRSIKDGVPGTEMPPSPLADDKIWQVASFVRSLSAPAITAQLKGDRVAGRGLFFGKAGCSRCHMVNGEGGFLGPDFSDAGAAFTVHQLREGLLKPNARIEKGFQPVRVVTVDGRRIEGVAKNHNNYSLQVLDAGGRLHLLSRGELAKVEFPERSPMPDDYGTRLDAAEIENLLAFLGSQSVRRREK